MKKPFARLAAAALALALAIPAGLPAAASTSDAPGWAAKAVQFNTQHSMIEDPDAWMPGDPAPRKSVVYALYQLDGGDAAPSMEQGPEDMGFAYLSPINYLFPAGWAKENGIVSGTKTLEDGRWYFGPENTVDRQQMVTFLYAYARYENRDLTGDPAQLNRFADGDRTAGWARNAMAWALENKLISGTGNNMLSPGKRLSRAELAVFLHAYAQRYAAPEESPTPGPAETPTPSPTETPDPGPGGAETPKPDATATPEATATPAPTSTPTPTPTPMPTPTPTPSPAPEVPVEQPTLSGFAVASYKENDQGDVMKVDVAHDCRQPDSSNEYRISFYTDGNDAWLDQVEFEVEDITPPAYKKLFEDMDCPPGPVQSSRVNITEKIAGIARVTGPCTNGPVDPSIEAKAGVEIVVTGNTALRGIKVTARLDGQVLDTVYSLSGKNRDTDEADHAFYKKVRERIEKQLWNDSMSNLEKLRVLADYINSTTRYPRSAATSKEGNPQFWQSFSVEGQFLFYDAASDVVLNRCMDLQGGIVTCQAQSILQRAAVEDLGLPYLYEGGDPEDIAPGEGVWSASGKYSSSPDNPWHESLVYKDADEKRYWLDAQGMELTETQYDYNAHILPLK